MTAELLRIEDFCSTYAVSRQTYYRLVARGEIAKPVKIGSASRVRRTDAEAWFASKG